MRIILNPIEGAPIKNVFYEDVKYFDNDDDDIWYPGTVREFEVQDYKICDFFMNLFGFLEEISIDKAQKIIEETKNIYSCKEAGCNFKTNIPVKLALHVKEHKRERELSALGIPKFKRKGNVLDELTEEEREREFEKQNQRDALTVGEGLVKEDLNRTVVMS